MGRPGGSRDDLPTLRVTNISEDTQENDLRDLFGTFGRVARVYVGRDRETGAGKGFAFVSFEEKANAQKAMDKMHGRGYDNLILSVQWSRTCPIRVELAVDLLTIRCRTERAALRGYPLLDSPFRSVSLPVFTRSCAYDCFSHWVPQGCFYGCDARISMARGGCSGHRNQELRMSIFSSPGGDADG